MNGLKGFRRASPLFFLLMAVAFPSRSLRAENLSWIFGIEEIGDVFGRPVIAMPGTGDYGVFEQAAGARYLDTSISGTFVDDQILAGRDGELLFMQKGGTSPCGLPGAAGQAVAIAHEDGFVSLYTGLSPRPDLEKKSVLAAGDPLGSPGMAGRRASLSIFDRAVSSWVNPVILMAGSGETARPRIDEIAVVSGKSEFLPEGKKSDEIRILQGNYSIAIAARDSPTRSGVLSGLSRMKIVLDGQVVEDRGFDAAVVGADGLSFLGLPAPSSGAIDRKGRYILGKRLISSGIHTLDVIVYDFSGNTAERRIRLLVS